MKGFFVTAFLNPIMFNISTITFSDPRTLLGTYFAITPCLVNLPIADFAFDVIQDFTFCQVDDDFWNNLFNAEMPKHKHRLETIHG
jgi:hypothetical protein